MKIYQRFDGSDKPQIVIEYKKNQLNEKIIVEGFDININRETLNNFINKVVKKITHENRT